MQFTLAIEISPYDYASDTYAFPDQSAVEQPDEWDHFWKKCISDSGLENLCAIRKGSYLVDITTIGDSELEIILRNTLHHVDWDFYEEQISPLCGGMVIHEDRITYIAPSCCGDLGSIMEWERILDKDTQSWFQLWIGHPWIYYKKENNFVLFSEYTDSDQTDFDQINSVFQVPETLLRNELDRLNTQRTHFASRIEELLFTMEIPHTEAIARLLTGLA